MPPPKDYIGVYIEIDFLWNILFSDSSLMELINFLGVQIETVVKSLLSISILHLGNRFLKYETKLLVRSSFAKEIFKSHFLAFDFNYNNSLVIFIQLEQI